MVTFKETEYEIEFDPEKINLIDKVKWTFKIWFGFKAKIKARVKNI